jgi:hypothetical protein
MHELPDAVLLRHLAAAVARARTNDEPPDALGLAATYALAVEIELRARTGLPSEGSPVQGEELLAHATRVLVDDVPVEWALGFLDATARL